MLITAGSNILKFTVFPTRFLTYKTIKLDDIVNKKNRLEVARLPHPLFPGSIRDNKDSQNKDLGSSSAVIVHTG